MPRGPGDASKELHDFMFDVESSAKKILKDASKRRKEQAIRERVNLVKEEKSKPKPKHLVSMPTIIYSSPREEDPVSPNKRASAAEVVASVRAKLEKKKLVPVVNHKDASIQYKKRHFLPGSLTAKAEHHVPRRLEISLWLNPDKKTHLETGLSKQAISLENELQGPTSWLSVDLQLKYRNETTRTQAWMASMVREQECERLRLEQQIYVPFVVVTRHPVHTDFEEMILEENMQAVKQSRDRNRLKTFSYDLSTIWTVNRPKLLIMGESQVHGISNRRDSMAHEQSNCQVQSVVSERALEKKLSQRKSVIYQAMETLPLKVNVRSEPWFRSGLFIRSDGALEETEEFNTGVVVSIYQEEQIKTVIIYKCHDSSEQKIVYTDDEFDQLVQNKKKVWNVQREQRQLLRKTQVEFQNNAMVEKSLRAKELSLARFWSCLLAASRKAKYNGDKNLLNEQDARACASMVEIHIPDQHQLFRQCLKIQGDPFLVTVGFAAMEQSDAIVFHLKRMKDFKSFCLVSTVASLEEWSNQTPISRKMLMSSSEWRWNLMKKITNAFEIQDGEMVLPGLILNHFKEDAAAVEIISYEAPVEEEMSMRDVIVEILKNDLEISEAIKFTSAEVTSEESTLLCLSICGSTPFVSLCGSLGMVPALFVRDPQISSTNSITCTLAFALDSPLKAPVLLSFDPTPETPLPLLRYAVDKCYIADVPPFIAKDVISKLDFRESCTIAVLSGAASDIDIGIFPDKNVQIPGHRRYDSEFTIHQFRLFFIASDFSIPDMVVPPFVFGITETAATLNAPDTWSHRYTWHSEELVDFVLTRKRLFADISYIVQRKYTVGSNDPNGYGSTLNVENCTGIHRKSKQIQLLEVSELEERIMKEERDSVLRARIDAASQNKEKADEQRLVLDQELNDKRLVRERQLRGKHVTNDEWRKRMKDPTTKKVGQWRRWQAYLYLDLQAKDLIMKAAEKTELEQLTKIARGERPKSDNELEVEAFNLAVKEGTLFYHEQSDDLFQWDQPSRWQGIAAIFQQDEKKIVEPAEVIEIKQLDENEQDNTSALQAADDVEHSRRLRFIEDNIRAWLDRKQCMSQAIDLRSVFFEMDHERTGIVSYPEFKLGLANMNIELTLEDQDTLIRHLDKESDNVVDYIEFVNWALYTCPESFNEWTYINFNMPELGPNAWKKMTKTDKLIDTIALHEEYKDGNSGQHYYYSISTDEYTWLAPEKVLLKKRQDRDGKELRQAQKAASLAAKAAVQSAMHAEKSSEKSIENIVSHLTSSKNFVDLVINQLGLREYVQEKNNIKNTAVIVPPLELSPSDSECDSDSDDSDFEVEKVEKISLEKSIEKPGKDWRILRPCNISDGFVTRILTPNTSGMDKKVWNQPNLNRPSLVGVVDPADVAHIPFEDLPPVEVKLITNVLQDSLVAQGDVEEEEEDIDLALDAFLAVKNGNYEKLEELLETGLQINSRDEYGNTMLICAAQQGNKRIVKSLLRRGCDMNLQNLSGNTALHYCFQYSFEKLVDYLIAKGADDSITNKDNLTCYEGLTKELVDAI